MGRSFIGTTTTSKVSTVVAFSAWPSSAVTVMVTAPMPRVSMFASGSGWKVSVVPLAVGSGTIDG